MLRYASRATRLIQASSSYCKPSAEYDVRHRPIFTGSVSRVPAAYRSHRRKDTVDYARKHPSFKKPSSHPPLSRVSKFESTRKHPKHRHNLIACNVPSSPESRGFPAKNTGGKSVEKLKRLLGTEETIVPPSSPASASTSHVDHLLHRDLRHLYRLEREAKTVFKQYYVSLGIPLDISISIKEQNHPQIEQIINTGYDCGDKVNLLHGREETSDTLTRSNDRNSHNTVDLEQEIMDLLRSQPQRKDRLVSSMSLSLTQSEDKYRHLCIKYRQLIAGWSALRPKYTSDMLIYQDELDMLTSDHFTTHEQEGVPSLLESDTSCNENSEIPIRKPSNHVIDDEDTTIIIPAQRAEYFLSQLEEVRFQRYNMIQYTQSIQNDITLDDGSNKCARAGNISSRILQWIRSFYEYQKTNTNSPPSSTEATSDNVSLDLQALKAYKSSNFTTTVRLYREVMRSYIHWYTLQMHEFTGIEGRSKENEEEHLSLYEGGEDHTVTLQAHNSDYRKFRTSLQTDLVRRLERTLDNMKRSYREKKNEHALPDRDIYHTLIKQYGTIGSPQSVDRVRSLLDEMKADESSSSDDINDETPSKSEGAPIQNRYYPTINSYYFALQVCKDAVANRAGVDIATISRIVDYSVELLDAAESLQSTQQSCTNSLEDMVFEASPSLADDTAVVSLSDHKTDLELKPSDAILSTKLLVLSIFGIAGLRVIPNLYERVDSLMERFIGKQSFRILPSIFSSLSVTRTRNIT